ncbi:primosomal protein DnaI [Paenibacillus guangzhouensis]|uniref:primosomal protein DnaI n=1 Tax=Paenibacillus guangzhouensis TaxID=1473112 RepID=UPI0012674FCD|nr:primosomal protein DnaI [Paenibacillus guangzhouensis]
MESLGDLLKRIPSQDMWQRVEQKKAELIANPLIVKLRAKYPEMTDQVIQQNMNRLYQYVTEYNNCSNCPGLDQCPNDMQGHYSKISCDTVNGLTQVYDSKVSCKKFLGQQRQDQIRDRIRSFYVDDRALKEGYSADEILVKDLERASAANQVLTYILRTKEEGLQTNGLYLVGKFGTGKTFLMCYLLYELAKEGFTGAIVYMPEFVEDLKSMMLDGAKLKETMEALKETDILIFDDVGAENMNPWARDHVLGSILNYRMNRKPTFYTSNYELDALEKHFSFTSKDGEEAYKGQRLMDRIRPFVDVIVVNGENKRGRQKN